MTKYERAVFSREDTDFYKPEHQPEKWTRTKKCIAALSLGLTLGSIGTPAAEAEIRHVQLGSPYNEQCPPVSPDALQTAHSLATYGTAVSRQEAMRRYENMMYDTPPRTAQTETKDNYRLYKTAADTYGLTVHDVLPYSEELNEDMFTFKQEAQREDLKLSFAEYLTKANEFLALYGTNIEVASQTVPGDEEVGLRVASDTELETNVAKMHIYEIMMDFASFPEEYTREINGLKKITLLAGGKDSVGGYAITKLPHEEIRYNIMTGLGSRRGPSLLKHEAGHLDSTAFCGNPKAAGNDPAYVAYNAPTAQYRRGDKTKAVASYEDIKKSGPYETVNLFKGTPVGDAEIHANRCASQELFNRQFSTVSFIDEYAGENPVEDTADTLSRVYDRYGRSDMTETLTPPIVTRKYEYQLGHLVQAYPEIAEYFTSIQYESDAKSEMLNWCEGAYAPGGLLALTFDHSKLGSRENPVPFALRS